MTAPQQHTNGIDHASIAARIRHARTAMEMSQAELADQLDVTVNSVCMWETGKHAPRGKNLNSITKFLDRCGDQPAGAKQHVVKRDGKPALRFTGRELGSKAFGGLRITIWRTQAGALVWKRDFHVDHGDEDQFATWLGHLSRTRGNSNGEVLAWALELGIEIYEDIA